MSTKNISIKFPSLIENIRIVESFIDNIKDKFEINDNIYGNIMISVTESVNNAIVHGNQQEKNKLVHLSVSLIQEKICFEIIDEGAGFDFENVTDPTTEENLEKVRGRGIFIMQQLCDEIYFENHGKKVRLIFYLG